MTTFGEPGGIYLTCELDLDRGEYVVCNEGGDELFADGSEREALRFCDDVVESEQAHIRTDLVSDERA